MPPIDWDEFRRTSRAAAETAGAATDAALASRISSACRLTDAEVKALFPQADDAARAAELLAIVNDATDQNQKVARLSAQIGDFAGAAVKLIGALS
jgi:hypothetical protein